MSLDEGGDDDDDDDDDDEADVSGAASRIHNLSFMIAQDRVQEVKRAAMEVDYPLMEEYDYLNSPNPVLQIDLRPSTKIRKYQVKSLSKMFGNLRARSGIIVLPCGAGKSLTGITAAHTIKRSTIVLCYNNPSVKQWKEQFLLFTNIPESSIRMFTSDYKDILPPATEACVVITTFSMISHSGHRGDLTQKMIDQIRAREWGLMLLDEVHVAPAKMFRRVLQVCNAHCKLGLTATLVREDGLIADLNFLVGPKLYEANWMDLTQQGYLANVQCCEVWCPMTKEFYDQYLGSELSERNKQLLYILNPTKVRACDYLVKYHEARNDKVILFCDDIAALHLYCTLMKRPYICGDTPEAERQMYINTFKTNPELNCLGLSRVGDVALDIPEASVIIQVASHFGARRQEAQRLGRILRPKSNMSGGFNAFFYTLVSTDTKEMYFSSKRQQYLIDQGYTFKVLENLVEKSEIGSTFLKTKAQELDVLSQICSMDADARDRKEEEAMKKAGTRNAYAPEVDSDDDDAAPVASRRTGSSTAIAGGSDLVYMEYDN
jgi:DNA excision repair protein ERCC-3